MNQKCTKSSLRLVLLVSMLISQSSFGQEIPELSLKKEVKAITSGTEILQQLTPISFKYNQKEFPYLENAGSIQYGFNADQVQLVLPNLVYQKNGQFVGGKNLYKSYSHKQIDEAGLIPILVASVKELQEQVNQLKTEIAQLKQTK